MKKSGAIRFGIPTLALATVLTASVAFADATPTNPVSVPNMPENASIGDQSKKPTPSFLDSFTLTYFGIFYGPSIGAPSNLQPDVHGDPDPTNPLYIDSTFFAGYKVTPDIKIGPGIEFFYAPGAGGDMTMQDLYLKVTKDKLIHNGNFNLDVDLRGYVPSSEQTAAGPYLTGLRFTQNATFEIPGTRLTVGSYSYVRGNIYRSDANSGPLFQLVWAPNAQYVLSKSLQATLWVDAFNGKNMIEGAPGYFATTTWDVQPGINWDITKNFGLNPYLNILPTNFNIYTTSIQMIVTAKFF